LVETLQDQLTLVRVENSHLRQLVTNRLPNIASSIISSCTTTESTLLSSLDENRIVCFDAEGNPKSPKKNQSSDQKYSKILMEPDFRLIHSLIHAQQNFVLSDPSLQDNPIVYASAGFLKMTGYKRQQVIGRNCRFLQGEGTDPAALEIIRKGLKDDVDVSICLLNYKADGTSFWNQLFFAPLRNSDGKIVNYIGVRNVHFDFELS
jgi:PAS domain S-box-containing protein